jgi:hypothetical protein
MRTVQNYKSPVGIWKVTTEGDCEGRSTEDLGVHEGHIVDIAFRLSGHALYGLSFSPAKPEDTLPHKTPRNKVNISLGINSGTWGRDMTKDEAADAIALFLDAEQSETAGVKVETCNYYACVTLLTNKEKI